MFKLKITLDRHSPRQKLNSMTVSFSTHLIYRFYLPLNKHSWIITCPNTLLDNLFVCHDYLFFKIYARKRLYTFLLQCLVQCKNWNQFPWRVDHDWQESPEPRHTSDRCTAADILLNHWPVGWFHVFWCSVQCMCSILDAILQRSFPANHPPPLPETAITTAKL